MINNSKASLYPKNFLDKVNYAIKKYSETPAPSIFVLKNDLGLNDPMPIAYTHNNQPSGAVIETGRINELMLNAEGKLVCQTGPANPLFLYRGQNKFFEPCVPTVYRCGSKDEILLKLKRTIQFESKLDDFEQVKEWQDKEFWGNKFYANKTAIAQHYGFVTNLLDFTSDFDIAAFFATAEFKGGDYHACREDEGVIYIAFKGILMMMHDLEIVGRQPIPRPDEQSAFALKMKQHENLNSFKCISKVLFKHRGVNSRGYLNRFHNGRDLFPNDDISNKLIEIKEKIERQTEFSDEISKEAELRYSKYFNE